MRELTIRRECWPVRGVFAISRGSRTEIEVVVAEIVEGACRGRAECHPYARYGETVEGVVATLEGMAGRVAAAPEPEALPEMLRPGAARNALDCALWDFRAKREGVPVWRLAGLESEPGPAQSAFTIGVDSPESMAAKARESADMPLLKLKLGGEGDPERVRAVRDAAPEARIMVDANEAWTADQYRIFAPELARLRVAIIEQPLPAGKDAVLRDLPRPVPLMADESCHDRSSLPALAGLYDYINIKLDKAGGLTEALKLAAAARESGFQVMAGSMLGTSLGMAPATLLGGMAAFVDLDGPLLLAEDRKPPLRFEGATVYPPDPALWG